MTAAGSSKTSKRCRMPSSKRCANRRLGRAPRGQVEVGGDLGDHTLVGGGALQELVGDLEPQQPAALVVADLLGGESLGLVLPDPEERALGGVAGAGGQQRPRDPCRALLQVGAVVADHPDAQLGLHAPPADLTLGVAVRADERADAGRPDARAAQADAGRQGRGRGWQQLPDVLSQARERLRGESVHRPTSPVPLEPGGTPSRPAARPAHRRPARSLARPRPACQRLPTAVSQGRNRVRSSPDAALEGSGHARARRLHPRRSLLGRHQPS